MAERNLGLTFGRTKEGENKEYNELLKRLGQLGIPNTPKSPDATSSIIAPDDNPPQVTPTIGWLYVPSIGMEFAPTLEGFGTNWYDSHKLVRSKGFIMPSPDETWALIFQAKANLAKPEFRKIYEFFTKITPKNSWHGEWQNAYFTEKNGKMHMHKLKGFDARGEPEFLNGVNITGTYLANTGYADISQRTNITPQGLCRLADSRTDYAEGKNIYFWKPLNGTVARFVAYSDRALLDCYRHPDLSNPALGVRFARRVAPSVVEQKGGKR